MEIQKNTCIGITGGSGFVGSHLAELLVQNGYSVIIFDIHALRNTSSAIIFVKTDFMDTVPSQVYDCDVLVHLAGAPIDGAWTEKYKQKIYDTRILSLRSIIAALKNTDSNKMHTLISASAIGIYGDRVGESVSESAPLFDTDFLSHVCIAWEAEVRTARDFGVRTVSVRTGIVLGVGGMLAKIGKWYQIGLGAVFGSGNECYNWIHVEDLARVYLRAIEDSRIAGPLCAVAPVASTTKEFADSLASIFHMPRIVRIPSFLLRFFFKEKSQLFLASARVAPDSLMQLGFVWKYETLQNALEAVYLKK